MTTENAPLERAIQAALWYLDSSVENPNGTMAAACYSPDGGPACEIPLERAVNALRATGLKPSPPQDNGSLYDEVSQARGWSKS